MAIISELLRFVLPHSQSSALAFSDLRRCVATKGLARTQYFGYVMPNEGIPRPKPDNQMCWYIEWPEKSTYRKSEEFKSELARLTKDKPRSLIFEFTETKPGEIIKGLESNACEFAIIDLAPHAPRFETDFEHSMHKTFTDCYFAKGFTGGGWAYALNSNDAEGNEIDVNTTEEPLIEEKDRKLAYYIIGWNTIAEHDEFAKTELFDEEIDKLAPHFAPGSGAFYVKFEKYG